MAERITTHKANNNSIPPITKRGFTVKYDKIKNSVIGKRGLKVKINKLIQSKDQLNWDKAVEINECIKKIDISQNPEYQKIQQEYQKIISGDDTLVDLLRYNQIIGTEQHNINLFNEIVEEVSKMPGIGDVSGLKINNVFDGGITQL